MNSILCSWALTILLLARRGNASGMPPASDHCTDNGGSEVDHYTYDGGLYVLCLFDDGTACDTWMFYGGSCNKGSTISFPDSCEASEGAVSRKSVEWGDLVGPASAISFLCTWDDDNGRGCDEYSYYYEGGCLRYGRGEGFGNDEYHLSEV
mmetsp:Transcript_11023/g.16777  ORF Transcript_11023/g.16777 Transcript_11023/m.16777 type:complete len:151 (-) Transcript_11023:274-726(-)